MANENGSPFNRHSFPKGFIFGTSSAAYQYEGEANKSNRGPSIWDTFVHEKPERIVDHSNGDVAIDFYHRYKEDVKLMKDIGMDAFRFSISWSRVIPSGSLRTGINKEGIQFYNDLINELVKNDIKPVVTIFHWDLPQALEDKYGGFLSRRIVDDFRDFANLCFQHFGDRVKQWITLNEPWGYSADGYSVGLLAPGKRTAHETYIVAHNLLLAHAHAVKLYRDTYQAYQEGIIGFSNCTFWFEPLDPDSDDDKSAAKRSLDFMLGWFVEPVIKGHYPKSMQIHVKKRLPKFTPEEVELVKGSVDFLGINHYTTFYATKTNPLDPKPICYTSDVHAIWTQFRKQTPIGPQAASSWLRIYPPGIKYLMNYIKDTYENPVIYITENGVDEFNHGHMTPTSLNDHTRIKYYHDYLRNLLESIKYHQADVRGFFCWSLLDNFEWVHGFTVRFGLIFVDYTDNLRRYPKASATWFKNFLQPPLLTSSVAIEQEILSDEGNETAAGHPNPSQGDYELRSKRARVAGEMMETQA